MAVVVDQQHGFKSFSRSQRCRLQSFTYLDYNFPLAHTIKQAFEVENIHRSFSTPCLSHATRADEEVNASPTIEILGGLGAPRVHFLVIEAAIGIASGIEPVPVSSGSGGAYFLYSKNGDVIAVAKSIGQEPLPFPKGLGGLMLGQPGLIRSVRAGETGIRELAAYILDHDAFAGVPPTVLVKISHVAFRVNNADAIPATTHKVASLQRYVAHAFDAGELSCSGFSISSVHRIGIFDVRILNLDRHAGNILVKKLDQQEHLPVDAELVPIDHGLCLPEWLDNPYFEWMHWPQAAVPFSESELDYISSIDPFKDADLLKSKIPYIRESSIRVLIICTIFLKQAADAGLCLADIGQMMTRGFCGGQEVSSVLENLSAKAKASIDDFSGDENEIKIIVEAEKVGIFQIGSESEETSKHEELNKSPSPMAKPPKVPKRATKEKRDQSKNRIKCHENGKVRDFSIQKNNGIENGGMSFDDLRESEWKLFLEIFETILLEEFEGTKCMRSSK